MDDEMQRLYNSMTPAEKAQFRTDTQKQFNNCAKNVGSGIKKEVHDSGIIGTIFKFAIAMLLNGK